MDTEARKKATMDMARDLYFLMPGIDPITDRRGELHWEMIVVTKAYQFCLRIAGEVVAANCRVFK